ncbi:GNAT family N-acetyltransferase [Enemella sp. A6]|uniref:GNAT family N-acetyltransferase n=1 Tax=Enemella sp. A6 TaxID=3440152 RepID=UPI003EBCFA0D
MPLPHLPIRTERLSLRPHHEADVDSLYRIYSRPEVARYLLEEPWSEAEAAQKVRERLPRIDLDADAGALALVIEHDRTVIGDVALWFTDKEHRIAEIGWVLDPEYGGRGYAAEAVRALLDLAFDHYHLHRVVAQMDGRNAASARLAAKIGMHQEAHLRQDWWSKGEWTDTIIYAMLHSDRA